MDVMSMGTVIGKLAVTKLLEVEPGNAGAFLTLSNTYASSGKWKD